jgi:hypothetical protein
MVQTRFQARARGEYIYDIPNRGTVAVQYEDIVNDSRQLINYLTSLNTPFDSMGLIELFEFIHDRPYVLYQFQDLREAIHDIIRALRPVLDDRYNEDGVVQTSSIETVDLMYHCDHLELIMNAVERL